MPEGALRPAGQEPSRLYTPPAAVRVGLARSGGSYEIVTLPLETYVGRVLAGEAAPASAPAALETLAIAIRTFALANLGRHRADGFDQCDQTHCQVLRPATTAALDRAAQATAGQVLLHRGAPASVFYSASCGGHTQAPSSVWSGADDPPYLPARKDDACEGEPAWTSVLSAFDLERTLLAAGLRGRLRSMRVVGRDGVRVARLAVDGMTPPEISAPDLRTAAGRTLGSQAIRSTAFELERDGDLYRLSGHGYGHGVGLCVIGSVKLAAAGESSGRILARYFPGLQIGTAAPRVTAVPPATAPIVPPAVAPSEVLVTLPDGDEAEQDGIVGAAIRARDELAGVLGVRAPRIAFRFHPTTVAYERATGRAWFTSGAVVDAEIHLVPLASLRERGVLERTIRRELVHVMVDAALAGKPAWVRDGAALYFSDPEAGGGPAPRVTCPRDAELVRPSSVGSLSDAYMRARACFARQIASGRSWRDVR